MDVEEQFTPNKAFAIFSQVGRGGAGLQGILPVTPGSRTIGLPQTLDSGSALETQVRERLLGMMNDTDKAKYKDQPISMTLAFEKDAECFNPIFQFEEPTAPVAPPVAAGGQADIKVTRVGARVDAEINLDRNSYGVLVNVANLNNPTPPDTPEGSTGSGTGSNVTDGHGTGQQSTGDALGV